MTGGGGCFETNEGFGKWALQAVGMFIAQISEIVCDDTVRPATSCPKTGGREQEQAVVCLLLAVAHTIKDDSSFLRLSRAQ